MLSHTATNGGRFGEVRLLEDVFKSEIDIWRDLGVTLCMMAKIITLFSRYIEPTFSQYKIRLIIIIKVAIFNLRKMQDLR